MSSPSIKPGTVIGGRYRIDRALGQGAMGAVYLATHEQLGSKVAVKFLDLKSSPTQHESLARFEREGRAAVAIKHPGIVAMLDLGTTPDGARYLVMEYLEGQTLQAFLQRVRALEPAQAAAVLVPMLDALEAAHRAGVVHRDLKPANV